MSLVAAPQQQRCPSWTGGQGLARGKGPAFLILAQIFYDLGLALGCARWLWVQREGHGLSWSMFTGRFWAGRGLAGAAGHFSPGGESAFLPLAREADLSMGVGRVAWAGAEQAGRGGGLGRAPLPISLLPFPSILPLPGVHLLLERVHLFRPAGRHPHRAGSARPDLPGAVLHQEEEAAGQEGEGATGAGLGARQASGLCPPQPSLLTASFAEAVLHARAGAIPSGKERQVCIQPYAVFPLCPSRCS